MVRCKDENHLDVALLEIAEGKLVANFNGTEDDFLKEINAVKEAAKRESGEISMKSSNNNN